MFSWQAPGPPGLPALPGFGALLPGLPGSAPAAPNPLMPAGLRFPFFPFAGPRPGMALPQQLQLGLQPAAQDYLSSLVGGRAALRDRLDCLLACYNEKFRQMVPTSMQAQTAASGSVGNMAPHAMLPFSTAAQAALAASQEAAKSDHKSPKKAFHRPDGAAAPARRDSDKGRQGAAGSSRDRAADLASAPRYGEQGSKRGADSSASKGATKLPGGLLQSSKAPGHSSEPRRRSRSRSRDRGASRHDRSPDGRTSRDAVKGADRERRRSRSGDRRRSRSRERAGAAATAAGAAAPSQQPARRRSRSGDRRRSRSRSPERKPAQASGVDAKPRRRSRSRSRGRSPQRERERDCKPSPQRVKGRSSRSRSRSPKNDPRPIRRAADERNVDRKVSLPCGLCCWLRLEA